jgi:predicted PhzF superfamily epimerase YddE/YHI9
VSRQSLPYWHVDAFADRPFAGNQAAVMPLGSRTTTLEIRLCGHATLASGHVLLERDGGQRVTFRTRQAGLLEVRRADRGGYELALPAIPSARGEWPEAARALGGNVLECWRNPDHYSLFVYASEAEVRALRPDFATLAALGHDSFTATAPGMETDVVSRVFVPGHGVDEDPVTGSAHALLTPYWTTRLGRPGFTAYQASARGGFVTCRLEDDRAWLGGQCVTVVEGRFYLG